MSDALKNLANVDVESVILENFVNKLKSKNIDKLSELEKYYKKNQNLQVNTSFDLGTKTKQDIAEAIEKILGIKTVKIDFAKKDDVICGVEILCPPLSISYGVNTYIAEFKKNLDDGLAELTKTAKTEEENK